MQGNSTIWSKEDNLYCKYIDMDSLLQALHENGVATRVPAKRWTNSCYPIERQMWLWSFAANSVRAWHCK